MWAWTICKEKKFIWLRILEPLYWHPWPRLPLLHHNTADEEKQPCAEEIRHRLTGAPELSSHKVSHFWRRHHSDLDTIHIGLTPSQHQHPEGQATNIQPLKRCVQTVFKLCSKCTKVLADVEDEILWDRLITESPDKRKILSSRKHDQVQEKNTTHGPRNAMMTEPWGGAQGRGIWSPYTLSRTSSLQNCGFLSCKPPDLCYFVTQECIQNTKKYWVTSSAI